MNVPAIVGLLREQPSKQPVAGARVRAYDRDDSTNDLIGEAVTDTDGRFTIVTEDPAFPDFIEDSPDVVLEIELPKGRTHGARRDLRWSAGALLPVTDIELPVEALEAPREPGTGKKEKEKDKEDEHDHDHE